VDERAIRFENVFNFRDLGGYKGLDGRTVRFGRLYRADDLCRLSGEDLATFADLGIRTVIDLRRPEEIARKGRVFEGTHTYRHAHLVHPDWPDFDGDTSARVEFLLERYLEMAEHGGAAIGASLRTVADPAALPLVFHCMAGKDRTGLVAAFTLYLLGVSEDDIADDYAVSEAAEEPSFAWHAARDDSWADRRWERFTVAPREVIPALFAALRERHGSIDGYLASIGITGEHATVMRTELLTQWDSRAT
jgi:protein-tyrosine phosphatase